MKSAFYASAFGGAGTGSRSRRAQIAEGEGKEPATRAAATWGFRSASALRRWIHSSEWHHVGKFANPVDYYDVAAWLGDHCAGRVENIMDAARLSRDLTRSGRGNLLRAVVAGIVRENLNCSEITRTPKSGLSLYYRSRQLTEQLGPIGCCYSTIGELKEKNWRAAQ